MVVGAREIEVGARVHVQRRRDVDHAEPAHARRVVQRQPVRHAAAPVVSAQGERGDAQRVHHRNEVLRQGAFAVVAVVRQARRV